MGRTVTVIAASGGRAPLRRRMMHLARARSASVASIPASSSVAIAWCLLEAWIPWKHSLTSCFPAMHCVQIRWPRSSPSVFASGISNSSLMPMAAFHISLEHVKPLSPVISLRSSVMALALCFSALQASRFDLGLWLTHQSSTLSRASSHLNACLFLPLTSVDMFCLIASAHF